MARRALIGWGVGALAAALVVGVSVVWPGLDARDTPPVDTGVWALQTAEGNRYARVNTAVGELDTVRDVMSPSSIVQGTSDAFMLSTSSSRITRIDAASPVDLDEESVRSSPTTPEGTVDVESSGDFVAYRTDAGAIFAGRLSQGTTARIDPYAGKERDEDAPDYAATAFTVTPDGTVFAYSAVDDQVLGYSITAGRVVDTEALPDVGDAPEMTAVGDTWFVVDTGSGEIWQRGVDAVRTVDTIGTVVLATAFAEGDATYLADEGGLVRIPLTEDPIERVIGGPENDEGYPARPVSFDGDVYAAWLGTDAGTMWRSSAGEIPLSYAGSTLDDSRRPVFAASDSTLILNDTRSGWVWRMPTGALIASSQNWSIDDDVQQAAEESDEQADVVLEPKPPVAVNDEFGVRAGAIVSLPVLLNDHDPNLDVLTVDPASVTGLDPGFGTVGVTDDGGRLTVTVTAGATGSATFSYAVTDGTTADGLRSNTATVTLTVAEDGTNTAPEFCGVTNCLATWPQPQVAPGGSLRTAVLNGWVDPEGDPILVLDATVPEGQGAAAVTMTGDVVYQHDDPSLTSIEEVPIEVTFADANGAEVTRVLKVTVTPTPELVAESFAETTVVGADLSIDVADHVTGATGSMELSTALLLDDAADAEATPVAGSTRFDLTAKSAGTYRVRYTVTDGASQAEGIVRVTLLASDAAAQLATPPVVVFIRPQEDATVDVLQAVSNPTGRVLLVSGVTAAQEDGALLQANAVGQNFIRVSGTTATDEPGRLGVVDYTVSDGSSDAGATITGQATVYLLPPVSDLAPMAADDALVVRAGAQIDIPVLDNDISPSGAALLLDPSTVTSSTDDALVFAAGSQLRYLAPTTPGDYTIEYGVYAAGTPSVLDTATVHVSVIGDETNRAPRPKVLVGRVLSGQSVQIDMTQYGVDPDGDAVVLDRIVDQPARGTASVTADGQGIVYVSNPGAAGGQDSFTYRVTDSAGESRVGIARVGVLDAQSDPAPVTFTDYVQVTAGQASKITVEPLRNDIDPTNGTLRITNVIPNLAEEMSDGSLNPEFARWQALLDGFTDDGVTLLAGATTGTMSYLYDVVSSSGNTERGLIIVKTVSEIVQDYPVITDTVLTTENRDTIADGVDVLSGRVTWTGGDASNLTLGLWQRAEGITASGWTLRGDAGDDARVVPFSVSGTLSDGTPITTYAFLRIPAADDLTVALRPNTSASVVEEKGSVDIDVRAQLVMPPDAELEVDSSVATTGARSQATCTLSGAATLTYTAGEGAPWTDACIVKVRVVGQDDWTAISLPIVVTALDPVPVLRQAAVTVIPGSSSTFDLTSMVSWQGREDWDALRLDVGSASGGVSVERSGDTITLTAADNAVPGEKVDIAVSITSHPDVLPSRVTVTIGPAPSDLPRGGTAELDCKASDGTSCSVRVVGAAGESNPFPQTPLVVQSVSAGNCVGVVFSVADAATIAASWQDGAAGTSCSVNITLVDAQGRATNGDRVGTVSFQLKGYPQAPDAITQVGYGDGTLTLRVTPGAAQTSSPAVTGFRVSGGDLSSPVTCDASGVCPAIRAANGEKSTYSVETINEVGASLESRETTAWAYAPPAAPASVTATPTVTSDGVGESVDLLITGVDAAATASLLITAAGADDLVVPVGTSPRIATTFRVGTNTATAISVVPQTRYEVPDGTPTSSQGGATTGAGVKTMGNGIGAPRALSFSASVKRVDFDTSTVTITADAGAGGTGGQVRYAIVMAGQSCKLSDATTATSRTFADLPSNTSYTFSVCAYSTGADGTPMYGTTTAAEQSVRVESGDDAPTGYTFTVNPTPERVGDTVRWMIDDVPAGDTPDGYTAEFSPSNPTTMGSDPGITVRWRSNEFGNLTQPGTVTPAKKSAPYQVSATWQFSCVVGEKPQVSLAGYAADGATPRVSITSPLLIQYRDEDGHVVLPLQPGVVPNGAVTARNIAISVDWKGSGWNLDAAQVDGLSTTCTGSVPEEPEPEPEPTDEPEDPGTTPSPEPTQTDAAAADPEG